MREQEDKKEEGNANGKMVLILSLLGLRFNSARTAEKHPGCTWNCSPEREESEEFNCQLPLGWRALTPFCFPPCLCRPRVHTASQNVLGKNAERQPLVSVHSSCDCNQRWVKGMCGMGTRSYSPHFGFVCIFPPCSIIQCFILWEHFL